jgi:hypothetical protein
LVVWAASGLWGGARYSVLLIPGAGVESGPRQPKQGVADMLMARIAAALPPAS